MGKRELSRRLRDAIAAAHAARNALPPPPGAERVLRGYVGDTASFLKAS